MNQECFDYCFMSNWDLKFIFSFLGIEVQVGLDSLRLYYTSLLGGILLLSGWGATSILLGVRLNLIIYSAIYGSFACIEICSSSSFSVDTLECPYFPILTILSPTFSFLCVYYIFLRMVSLISCSSDSLKTEFISTEILCARSAISLLYSSLLNYSSWGLWGSGAKERGEMVSSSLK